ncbi:Transposon Ty3-I Gag-Pol polyprotein [Dictyocoela muelleri]|nr:Transposon Ty3-I Gag-Pol polyprotein [Dictyocoela muelleri]
MKNKIIEEKNSEIISSAFVIKKRNGKIRLVVDYRNLNSITRKTHQITLKIYEILAKLNGSKNFTSIDLNQGYYQIKMEDKDVYKTGFKIINRKFVFLKMPFGLCNAPSTFQSAMNKIFSGFENVIIYIDDILIFTKNKEEHYNTLKAVLNIIKDNKMSINFEKSIFCVEKINFRFYNGLCHCKETRRDNEIILK